MAPLWVTPFGFLAKNGPESVWGTWTTSIVEGGQNKLAIINNISKLFPGVLTPTNILSSDSNQIYPFLPTKQS